MECKHKYVPAVTVFGEVLSDLQVCELCGHVPGVLVGSPPEKTKGQQLVALIKSWRNGTEYTAELACQEALPAKWEPTAAIVEQLLILAMNRADLN